MDGYNDYQEKDTIEVFEILKIKQSSQQASVDFKEGLYGLLKENENYYRKIDRILSELGKSEFIPAFKVIVEHYPLDSLEVRQLDSLRIFVEKAKSTGDALLDDTQLNILKLSDNESAYLYATLEAISDQYLNPLARILEYQDFQIHDLISREELFNSLWIKELPSAIIQIDSEEELERSTYSGPGAENYQFTDRNITTALAMAEYATKSIESIEIVLAEKLKTEKSQQDLSALEKQLIDQSEVLKQLIDSLSINSSGSVSQILDNINKISASNLSEYAALEDVDRKMDFGQSSLNCLILLQHLSNSVGSLQAKDEEIKAKYMDAIWQPFISVVMEEEVKKRITAAYRKILIPHLLDRMLNELKCDNAAYFNDLLGMLHTRMFELREEDTSKLERKLKREQDPLEILDLFNVELKNED